MRRLLISFVIGLVLAWGMSEVSFALLRDSSDHVPQRVELDIPAGTADRVAAGEVVPSLPPEMAFVVGDVLVVRNDDLVSHQLGPVWVPPGSSSVPQSALERPEYSYACSFQPSRYLGLDVRSRVTLTTRVLVIVSAGPPMAAPIGIYSLIVRPVRQPPAARPALP